MNTTTGIWTDEKVAAAAFDECIGKHNLFQVYEEVRGVLTQPLSCQEDKSVRIDRIAIPKFDGWTLGAIGIELKRSDTKIGRPISQMLDYRRALWCVGPRGIEISINWAFLWPAEKENGALASIFAQQHIGTASPSSDGGIDFFCGEEVVLRIHADGTYQIGARAHQIGKKAGSR